MSKIVFGLEPDELLVTLTRGGGLAAQGTLSEGTWQAGDTLELRFDTGVTWPATLTGAIAQWSKTAAEVTALVGTSPTRAGLWYTGAGTNVPLRWGSGSVVIQS